MNDVATKSANPVVLGGRPIPVPDGVDPAIYARRQGRLWTFTVEKSHNITPHMRRVRFIGDELAGWSHKPGQEIILRLPQANGEIARRHYTVRNVGSERSYLDVDFVLHGESPATRWALAAKPGDSLDLTGPRGRIVIEPQAEWHLFSGDELHSGDLRNGQVAAEGDARLRLSRSRRTRGRAAAQGGCGGQPRMVASQRRACSRAASWPIGSMLSHCPPAAAMPTSSARPATPARSVRRDRPRLPREQISAEGYWRPGRVGGHDHVDDSH